VSFSWPWPRRTSYYCRCRAAPDLRASLAGVEPEPWLSLLHRGFHFYRSPIILGVCGCLAAPHPCPPPRAGGPPPPLPYSSGVAKASPAVTPRCPMHPRTVTRPAGCKGVDPGGLMSVSSLAPSAHRTCCPALPPWHP
jgi:hypothetical protein